MKRALLALLGICTVAACGGTDIENQHPIVTGFIEPITVFENERQVVAVANYFSDPDGDSLTYTVSNADPQNLGTYIDRDTLTIEGLGETTTTAVITATDIHNAEAELSFEVTVVEALRDEFESDRGWIGMKGLIPRQDIVSIRDGHMILSVSREDVPHYALLDVENFGPNWLLSARFTRTQQVCGGIMALPEAIPGEDTPPRFAWAMDLDPFNGWFVSLYMRDVDDWIIIEEGVLPPTNQDQGGYVELSLGYTQDNLLYGYAYDEFKLFEFDMNHVHEVTGLDLPPNIIRFISAAGQPCPANGNVRVDWISVEIREES